MNRPLFRRLFPPRVGQQLDEELQLHRDLLIGDLQARGHSAVDAAAQADRRLGDLARARTEAIEVGERYAEQERRTRFFENLRQDFRFAWRGLGRQKGWTAVALVTLALGIGACTAVFSVVNSLLLHPIPYPRPADIVLMSETTATNNEMQITVSPFADVLAAWQLQTHSFDQIEEFSRADMTRQDASTPSVVRAVAVQPSFLAFAGQHLIAGRNFTAPDAIPGGARVAILNELTWRRDFGALPTAIGRSVTLDGNLYTIIGVYPRQLQVTGPGVPTADYWLPLIPDSTANLSAVGRLKPGVTIAAAQRELDTLASRAHVSTASEFRSYLNRPAEMVNFRDALKLLAGAVALVLLIACANVAHLLLARGASREREFAIRTALGAGRFRLVRQLVTESTSLAVAGCVMGVVLGWAGLHLIIAVRPDGLAELDAARVDTTVVIAAVGASLLTGLIFGLTNVLQLVLRAPHAALKAGSPASGSSRGDHRLRGALVISEMALAAMLLVGATLLVRSMIRLQRTDIGFDPAGLYAMGPLGTTGTQAGRPVDLGERVLAGMRTIPGVTDVQVMQNAPPNIGVMFGTVEAEGMPVVQSGPYVWYNAVRPDFFTFLHVRMQAGTTFTDTTTAAGQVIVNEGLAKMYWPGTSAVGRRMRMSPKQAWLTIVGVAPDIGLRGSTIVASSPMIYFPQIAVDRATIVVRTRADINPMPAIRKMVSTIDPHLPPPTLTSVEDEMRRSLARPRFTMLLLTFFTLIAVVLGAVGLYGVLAYTVSRRTREIGIRMALGATRGRVIRTVLALGLGLASTGAILGLAGALWGTRWIESMLYGVPRTDPVSFVVGAAVLLLTAAVACIVPARRAVRIDPMTAIRAE